MQSATQLNAQLLSREVQVTNHSQRALAGHRDGVMSAAGDYSPRSKTIKRACADGAEVDLKQYLLAIQRITAAMLALSPGSSLNRNSNTCESGLGYSGCGERF